MNKQQILSAILTTMVAGTISSTAFADHHEKSGKGADKAAKGAATTAATTEKAAAPTCLNNTCKGKSACAGNGNASCAGHNTCKGKGWLEAADEAACTKAGGKWAAAATTAK